MNSKLLFKSSAMKQLVKQAEAAIDSDVPFLIYGETGIGKNMLAYHLHEKSKRRDFPLLRIDCSELSKSLFESEIFGHEKGAFTGAVERKKGYLDLVNGGTLFLDEVENLDTGIQAKMLNIIDTGQFWRVGGRKMLSTEFRLISATNTDIEDWISTGKFRKDFFYRLKGYVIKIPPLRQRREDIPLFINYCLNEAEIKYGKKYQVSKHAKSCLLDYDWPGNIRELKLILAAVCAAHPGGWIELDHLPLEIQTSSLLTKARQNLWSVDDVVKSHVKSILNYTGNNKTRTAEILGWSVNTLKNHLKKWHYHKCAGENKSDIHSQQSDTKR